MGNVLETIERRIAAQFDRRYCVLTGSGTAALYAAFRCMGLKNGSGIVYPDLTCETAVNAAVFAYMQPMFCDVDRHSFTMDPEDACVKVSRESVSAVVATHLFGHLQHIPQLQGRLTKDVVVVEDAAQGYGGMLDDLRVGSLGDASVLSFGEGKLLDCGGGGALLTDSADMYANCRDLQNELCDSPEQIHAARAACMRDLFSLRKRQPAPEAYVQERAVLMQQHRDGYVFRIDSQMATWIEKRFSELQAVAERRRSETQVFNDVLSGVAEAGAVVEGSQAALWRYAFLLPVAQRDAVLERLLRKNINATKLFAPMHRQYGLPDADYPHATGVYERIINVVFEFGGRTPRECAEIIRNEILDAAQRSGNKDSSNF
ncbi:DegT/DnrJ/EryC1/StrS family aminotransferase [Thermodesulfobacteriota bacterium]